MGIEVGDPSRAEQYFARSAFVDLTDNQGNTAEGMHIASAGGTWQVLVCGFGGFRVVHGQMSFSSVAARALAGDPLPAAVAGRPGCGSPSTTRGSPSTFDGPEGATVPVLVHGRPVELTTGTTTVPLRGGGRSAAS